MRFYSEMDFSTHMSKRINEVFSKFDSEKEEECNKIKAKLMTYLLKNKQNTTIKPIIRSK